MLEVEQTLRDTTYINPVFRDLTLLLQRSEYAAEVAATLEVFIGIRRVDIGRVQFVNNHPRAGRDVVKPYGTCVSFGINTTRDVSVLPLTTKGHKPTHIRTFGRPVTIDQFQL